MEKLTKEDIKGPDVFIKQAVIVTDFADKHRKTIIGSLVGLVAIALLWAGWGFYIDNQESKAQDLFYQAQKKLKTLDEKNTEAAATIAGELKAISSNYGVTQAGVLSALEASRLYFNANKNQEAIDILEKAAKSARNSTVKALVLNNLASNYEAVGQWQKAVDTLNLIETRDDMNFMHGQVLLKKGLNFEKLGQKDKAEQMYKKAEGLTKFPDVVSAAKKYLRTL